MPRTRMHIHIHAHARSPPPSASTTVKRDCQVPTHLSSSKHGAPCPLGQPTARFFPFSVHSGPPCKPSPQATVPSRSPGCLSPPASGQSALKEGGPSVQLTGTGGTGQTKQQKRRAGQEFRSSGLRGPPAAGRAQLSLLALFLYLKHSALTWRRREGQPRKPGGLT